MCQVKKPTSSRSLRTNFNVGTLNVRGLNSDLKTQQFATDMSKYQLAILAIQESKFKEEGISEIQTPDKKKNYDVYHAANSKSKHHGVGIVIEKGIEAEFKTITDRICTATIKLEGETNQKKVVLISTYAPTLEVSEKKSKIRDDYYEDLERTINSVNKRDMCIIGGDQNTKTGMGHKEFPDVIGRYGKGEMNTSGRILAETLLRNNMILCNTMFPHKICHRTTWQAPERVQDHNDRNGDRRRNPYRNQIDYLMLKKEHQTFVNDARSYSGIETFTDHRLVTAKINIKWYKMKAQKTTPKLNVEKLRDEGYRKKYQDKIKGNIEEVKQAITVQEKWTSIVKVCKKAREEVVGTHGRVRKSENEERKKLSEEQKRLRDNINSTRNKKKEKQSKKI